MDGTINKYDCAVPRHSGRPCPTAALRAGEPGRCAAGTGQPELPDRCPVLISMCMSELLYQLLSIHRIRGYDIFEKMRIDQLINNVWLCISVW